jgi:hypothetical protein
MMPKKPAAIVVTAPLWVAALLWAPASVALASPLPGLRAALGAPVLEGPPAAVAVAGIDTRETLAGRTSDAEVGFLDITCDPPARILIDDADTGKVTPQPHVEIQAGHHKLTLVTLDGAHSRTFGFTVEAGKTRKFTVHLAS